MDKKDPYFYNVTAFNWIVGAYNIARAIITHCMQSTSMKPCRILVEPFYIVLISCIIQHALINSSIYEGPVAYGVDPGKIPGWFKKTAPKDQPAEAPTDKAAPAQPAPVPTLPTQPAYPPYPACLPSLPSLPLCPPSLPLLGRGGRHRLMRMVRQAKQGKQGSRKHPRASKVR